MSLAERKVSRAAVVGSLAAVSATLVLSAIFGSVLATANLAYLGLPFSRDNTLESALLNSAILLGLVLLGTALLFVLLRTRKILVLPAVMAVAVFFSFWGILEIFFAVAVSVPEQYYFACDAASLALAALTAFLILKPLNIAVLNVLLMLYGAMAGAIFYAALPPWSVASAAVALAVYDLYSVFRGPLKHILEGVVAEDGGGARTPGSLRGAVVYVGGLALGMGDVLVYSMLSPLYLLYPKPSPLRWILSCLGVLLGLLLTLRALEKRRFMPALPLPVCLSMAFYSAAVLLSF